MIERKETIDIKKANVVALVILAVSAALFLGLYFLVGYLKGDFATDDSLSLTSWPFCLALVGGIVAHELIHGLFWAFHAGFKSISFGVMWRVLTPYCHCSKPLKVKHYMMGALAPLIILGVIPAIAGATMYNMALTVYGIFFISSAAGDIMVAWRLLNEPADNTVLDHPTEAGYIVYEDDD